MIKRICFFTTHYVHSRQRMMEYYESVLPEGVEMFLLCLEGEKEKYCLGRTKKEYPYYIKLI
jgi:hypothetical protein